MNALRPPNGSAVLVAPELDSKGALRATGQRVWLVPGSPPGPLIDPDGEVTRRSAQPVPVGLRPAPPIASPSKDRLVVERVGSLATQNEFVACQHSVDTKAFKGKGEARLIRRASLDVDKLHAQMADLAKVSTQLGKNVLYLMVHSRSTTDQHSLRWRGHAGTSGGSAHKHLTWAEASTRISAYPYEVMLQLKEWDEQAKSLNAAEQKARALMRQINGKARCD